MPFSIISRDLWSALAAPNPPIVIDVRRRELAVESGKLLPASRLADHADGPTLAASLPRDREIVVACAHGHNRSQRVAAHLRSEGFRATTLEGGYDAWTAEGLPLVNRSVQGVTLGEEPTVWVTRRRPKIDRIACPWLVSRFLDPRARFLFVDPDQVLAVAADEKGIAYDLPGGVFEHEGELCTFDILVREFGLGSDAQLAELALIVRAADTDRLDLVPQAAGLLAVSLGLSARHGEDDHALLKEGFVLYDGLLAWLREAKAERHNWPRTAKVAA